jgi:hypothetical protein
MSTKAKIESLTPEQEAYLPVFRQKYLDIATKGGRINKENLQRGINDAYTVISQPTPTLVILKSPLMALRAIKLYELLENKKKSHDEIMVHVNAFAETGVVDDTQLAAELMDNDTKLWNSDFLWGSQDLYWIAWYRFGEYIGVEYDKESLELLDIMERISVECEWWWPFEGVCFVSERPVKVSFDEQDRLHCENGPAIKYEDGYSLFAWHGTTIPGEWITDKDTKLTPQIALSQANAELRRCACEILGWINVLEHPSLNPKVIDEDVPAIGTIIQVDLPDAPEQWFIKFQCGTGRWFAEAVNDKRFNTALKANAGKRGWRPEFTSPPEHFVPFVRT